MWTALAIAIFVGIGAVAGMVAAFIALTGELSITLTMGRDEHGKDEDRGHDGI